MASIINSDDGVISGTAGLKSTGANDGALNIQTNGTNAITVSSAQTVAINGNNISADNSLGFRNRIINGDMMIDQRNAGALVNPAIDSAYYLDRWFFRGNIAGKFSVGQNAGSVTPPTGFTKYLGYTSLSAYSVGAGDFFFTGQIIEGYNIADLGFGTASAKTITISFKVYSSLTGTFGGTLRNGANNRYCPFSYTISSANTWTTVSVTIAGDTTGTWATDNTAGLYVYFNLGTGSTYSGGTSGTWGSTAYFTPSGTVSVVGTNAATFYITGVQLEVGSVATPFERRDYGRELIMCQRYYYKIIPKNANYFTSGFNNSTTVHRGIANFPTSMRTEPTAIEQTGTAADYGVAHGGSTVTNLSAVVSSFNASVNSSRISVSVASGLTQGQASMLIANNDTAFLAWSAEL